MKPEKETIRYGITPVVWTGIGPYVGIAIVVGVAGVLQWLVSLLF